MRTALHLGFTVVPYEHHLLGSIQNVADPTALENLREQGEAQNIHDRILKRDPRAKIVVCAGYGHIGKMPTTVDWAGGAFPNAHASATAVDPDGALF